MKIALLCSLVILLFISVQDCSSWGRRRRRRSPVNIDKSGINYNKGRHNTNVNLNGGSYNYRGNQWNTNVRHNFRSQQTNLNANYRKNHNFNVGHNSQNGQTNAGYTYNFGRRRRSIKAEDKVAFKLENNPKLFLEKLDLLVKEFVQEHHTTVPELKTLTVISVGDSTSNVTVAKEVVCLVQKLQRILPQSLGNFVVKMIKFHGPSFNINDLGDFFTIDPKKSGYKGEDGFNDEYKYCQVPGIETVREQTEIESTELLEIKKFVASLIKVAMEYQLILEE